MRLLVTVAPFHRFELRPLLGRAASRRPGRRLRRPDLCGNQANLDDVRDRGRSCTATSATSTSPSAPSRTTRSTPLSTSRPSRTTRSRSSTREVLHDERARHPVDPRGRPAQRRDEVPPHLDVRGLRGHGPRHPGAFTEEAVPATDAVQRGKGCGTTRCARTTRRSSCPSRSRTARTTTARTSFREVIPVFTTKAMDDQPIPLYASSRTPRVAPRHRPLRGNRDRAAARTHRRDVPCGSGVEKSIEQIADTSLRRSASLVAQDDRPRPSWPRPPLPARHLEDPN